MLLQGGTLGNRKINYQRREKRRKRKKIKWQDWSPAAKRQKPDVRCRVTEIEEEERGGQQDPQTNQLKGKTANCPGRNKSDKRTSPSGDRTQEQGKC